MTRDEKIALARDLREQGMQLREIAAEFGVSTSTVLRWTDPVKAERDRERARAWKARNPDRRRELDRAALERSKTPCPGCGEPCLRRTAAVCQSCQAAAVTVRRGLIEGMWADGWTLREITAALNTTKATVAVEIARMRADGWDLPHRRSARDLDAIRAGQARARERARA